MLNRYLDSLKHKTAQINNTLTSSVQVILNVSEQAYELESGYVDEVGTFLED